MMIGWIEVNDTVLRYDIEGKGTTPLVLIHELGGSLESWDPVLPALQSHFNVLRYDQRGFGLSEKIRGCLTLETVLGDLLGLLNGLGITDPCPIIGASLGAGIAIAFAAKHPGRISRLVACNPATGIRPERRAYIEQRAEIAERDGMRACVEQSLNNSYPKLFRADQKRFLWYRHRWLTNDPFGFAAINRMLPDMDLTNDYALITCPALLLAGLHDTLIPTSTVQSIAQAIPGAQYVEVDTSHFMAVQTPEKMLAHVLPFLKTAPE